MLVSFAAVINNPKSQWFLATKFYFQLTLRFGRRSVWAWLLLTCLILSPRLKRRPLFWSCHSHGRRNRARGQVETCPDSQSFCSAVACISSCYRPLAKESHMSERHVKGQAGAIPSEEALQITRQQEAEGTSAFNSIIYHSSLVRQGILREEFPSSFTSPFAPSTNKPTQKGV